MDPGRRDRRHPRFGTERRRGGRPGFANGTKVPNHLNTTKWNGVDVDYCRALASALFGGDLTSTAFVPMRSQPHGFQLMAQEAVDVMAGATWTIPNDIRESSTGKGYTFSRPYFYAPTIADEHDEAPTR